MSKRLFSALVSVILVFCVWGAALAQGALPVVTLSFDLPSWTYTYHVVIPANAASPFGELGIYSQAVGFNDFEDLWTPSGPWVNDQDQGWAYELTEGDYGTTVRWRAYGEQEVPNGPSSWEGDFKIIAPNTLPVAGRAYTKDGAPTMYEFDIDVPGAVPEPSSLVAFGSLVAAAGMLIRRRR